MQADDSEEASSPSSPTEASGSQRCKTFFACPVLTPRDWPLRFQHRQWGWPGTQGAASTWGKTKWTCSQVVSRQILFVGMISKSTVTPLSAQVDTQKRKDSGTKHTFIINTQHGWTTHTRHSNWFWILSSTYLFNCFFVYLIYFLVYWNCYYFMYLFMFMHCVNFGRWAPD